MAIYRSDQASVTFAAEGSPGAYPEDASLAASSLKELGEDGAGNTQVARTVSGALAVGATSITLSGVMNNEVSNNSLVGNSQCVIIVGDNTATGGPREVRKVVDGFGTATITLDHPLAFAHADGTVIKGAAISTTSIDTLTVPNSKYITWLPGVYEAVDVPDPEQAFEPYYVLGGQNRNAYAMYPGQETLAGSIGGMVLLNATPLRFSLGSMVTKPTTLSSTNTLWKIGTASGTGSADKGATQVNVYMSASEEVLTAGDYVLFGAGTHAAATDFSTDPTETFEVRQLVVGTTSYAVGEASSTNSTTIVGTGNPEWDDTSNVNVGDYFKYNGGAESTIASIESDTSLTVAGAISGSGTYTIRAAVSQVVLNTPLQFAHSNNEAVTVVGTDPSLYHTIWEKTALDSITMDVNVLDYNETAANTWQRRYVGGKVGGMTISAEEGGLVTVGWDSMLFLDMLHNMKQHSALSSGTFMPRYGMMQDIGPTSVGKPVSDAASTVTYTRPSTAPYYFSQGEIRFYGTNPNVGSQVLARLRSFSITVSNSEEPRYYLSKQQEGKRGPTEIMEQRREYSMSCSIAMEDSNTGAAGVANTARNVFKELLLAGDYRGDRGLSGFAIVLTFTRGANDSIQIRIPGENFSANANMEGTDTLTGQVTSTGGEQGAFIRSATHNINDANPIEAELDIIFRSMIINIRDSELVYP